MKAIVLILALVALGLFGPTCAFLAIKCTAPPDIYHIEFRNRAGMTITVTEDEPDYSSFTLRSGEKHTLKFAHFRGYPDNAFTVRNVEGDVVTRVRISPQVDKETVVDRNRIIIVLNVSSPTKTGSGRQ